MSHLNTQRYLANLDILKQLKNNKGQVSAEILKGYSGWGGLREAIYTPAVYGALRKVLTQEEINSLKKTLKNAYYTPRELVNFIYSWLISHGFKGGAILEPAVGNGAFLEHMPAAIQANSQITTVELDQVTSEIVSKLYPNVQLYNCPFEQFQPAEQFDLIIGNPPYGADHVMDTQHADLKDYCIHHYFVAKSMRLLKKGGILAMVLPCYFLDNQTQHVRKIIHQEGGGLITAYRLPDDLFSDAKVTVDIVFLRKGEASSLWTKTTQIEVAGKAWPINEFFYNHSSHILGNLEVVDLYERKAIACKRRGNVWEGLRRELRIKQQESWTKQHLQTPIQTGLATLEQKIAELNELKQQFLSLSDSLRTL